MSSSSSSSSSFSSIPGRLFIGGLVNGTTEDMIHEHFRKFGKLRDVLLKRNKISGNLRGFAYIQFYEPASVAKVLQEQPHVIHGKEISVDKAYKRTIRKIFVGGLPSELTEEEYTKYFMTFGKVEKAVINLDPGTKRSRGFGFVTFQDVESAKKVLMHKNGWHRLAGKLVEVKEAIFQKDGQQTTPTVHPTFDQIHPAPNHGMAAGFQAYAHLAPLPGYNGANQPRDYIPPPPPVSDIYQLPRDCVPMPPLPLHMMNQASDLHQGYVPPPPLPQHLQQALSDICQPREFEFVPGHNYLVRIDGCLWNLNSFVSAGDYYSMGAKLN